MPGTFIEELTNGVRNAFCTVLEAQNNYYGYVGQNPFFITARLAQQFFDTAYRVACNREPPDPPSPPFTGGQCAINYTVNTAWTRKARIAGTCVTTGTETATNFSVLGPIAGLVTARSGSNLSLQIAHGAGGTSRTTVYTYADATGCPAEFVTYSITSVTPPIGVPDNCGNPPAVTPTPDSGYNSDTINITYTDVNDNDITLPVSFIFAPVRVNIKGELTVPIRIDVGGIDLQFGGDINLSTGGIEINYGNPNYNRNGLPNPDGYQPPDTTPDPPADVPVDVPNPSPDSNEPDTSRILRGCIVTTTVVPPDITVIFQEDNPTIYAPNLGYVQFAINVGGVIAWTADIPVKNKRHFVPCPWEGGAVAVRGTARSGVSWTISPVYALVEDVIEFA